MNYYPQLVAAAARHLGVSTDVPWRDLPEKAQDKLLVRAGRPAHPRRLPHARRPRDALVLAVRGRARERDAALRGVRERAGQGQARGVHGRHPVQDVRRRAAEARDPRGDRRRQEHPRGHGALGEGLARVLRGPRPHRARRRRSRARVIKEIRRAAALPRRRGARLPHAGARHGHALRRRGPAHPARHADRRRAHGRALHPRRAVASACTSATTRGSSPRSSGCATSATPCIVVEHDEETIRAADFVVDMGPGAGEHGGEIVCVGTPEEILACADSLTGGVPLGPPVDPDARASGATPDRGAITHARRRREQPQGHRRRDPARHAHGGHRRVAAAASRSLVTDTLAPALTNADLPHAQAHRQVTVARGPRRRSTRSSTSTSRPIGRTPRSNPATYTGVWDDIRSLFASTPEAKARGYSPGRFCFNVIGGRCEACKGDGQIKIEMHFLPDVYVPCEVCKGARYNRETLQVTYKGKTRLRRARHDGRGGAALLREHPADQAQAPDALRRGPRLHPARPAGDHAVRRRGAAREARERAAAPQHRAARSTSSTSPPPACTSTTSASCSIVLQRLVDGGNTVLVIEHNLDVIKSADHIIDLGPEGGDRGGDVIATGHARGDRGVRGLAHRPLPRAGARRPRRERRARDRWAARRRSRREGCLGESGAKARREVGEGVVVSAVPPSLREQLDSVPDAPGVYLWKDAEGEVLYVGKAKSLRKRMRQYVERPRRARADPADDGAGRVASTTS